MSMLAARHLLIKHQNSRNPVSRRTGQSTANVTVEQAQEEMKTIIDKIKAEGATEEVFAMYAQARSDCGSFQQGGDLGAFGPGQMQQQFEQGTRDTPVGGMSGIVESDSGTHIIFRYEPEVPLACRHLLIKHQGSRNPVSRRTGESTSSITMEQAHAEMKQIIDDINQRGATEQLFAEMAAQRSDCGSFKNGGDLGSFGPGQMQKQFEEGTRNTEVGTMSGIVESDSGTHIIFRYAPAQ